MLCCCFYFYYDCLLHNLKQLKQKFVTKYQFQFLAFLIFIFVEIYLFCVDFFNSKKSVIKMGFSIHIIYI
jgi:hypothetical protein